MTKPNSVDKFISSHRYQKRETSESPDEFCENCCAYFTFDGRGRCYVYEQQNFNDTDREFNPKEGYNCTLFIDDLCFHTEINTYTDALERGVDPKKDEHYLHALEEANNNHNSDLPYPNNTQ